MKMCHPIAIKKRTLHHCEDWVESEMSDAAEVGMGWRGKGREEVVVYGGE